jgi:dGTPase
LRSAGQHDRDRILYSSALRRLVGITQVVAPIERQVTHSRLTHTLEVAQIARRLAEYLTYTGADKELADSAGGIDSDVVEAAALAHDIGHPPFSHVAEEVLDAFCKTLLPEGFNGNAQSFRILTKLAVRSPNFPGLNLTRATLNAVMKYPCFHGGRFGEKTCQERWGSYLSESDDFR